MVAVAARTVGSLIVSSMTVATLLCFADFPQLEAMLIVILSTVGMLTSLGGLVVSILTLNLENHCSSRGCYTLCLSLW